MGFTKPEYWSGSAFPPSGDLPEDPFLTQGLNLSLLGFLHWQMDYLLIRHLGSSPQSQTRITNSTITTLAHSTSILLRLPQQPPSWAPCVSVLRVCSQHRSHHNSTNMEI